MAISNKTKLIEAIFDERYDDRTETLENDVVTFDDIKAAMKTTGSTLSDANLANCFKDIVRSPNRNSHFPGSVFERGYTGEQYIGSIERGCFRFVPVADGQTAPFAERAPDPGLFDNVQEIQSVSLNLQSRRLGRRDESWLTQVVVNMNVVSTHLALHSAHDLVAVQLLQTNMKLRKAEIDALLLGAVGSGKPGETADILICCEMKHRREMLEEEQILRGAQAGQAEAAKKLGIAEVAVIPMAVKALDDGLLWVIEYASDFPPLASVNECLYRLNPPVPGIA